MTLIETLASAGILVVVISLSLHIFVGVSRLSVLETSALDRLRTVEDARAIFGRTVREARGIVEGVGAYKTGSEVLVLELPPEPGEDGLRYVIFGRVTSKKRLGRIDVAANGGQYTIAAYSTYAVPVSALRFDYGGADPTQARLVSLDLDVPNAAKNRAKPPVTYRFKAALRGTGHRPDGGKAR